MIPRSIDGIKNDKYFFLVCFQVVVIEEADSSILGILNDAVPEAERNFANDMITVHISTVTVNRENVDASFEKGIFLCILYKLRCQTRFTFNICYCFLYYM